jgi:hypothetical protein
VRVRLPLVMSCAAVCGLVSAAAAQGASDAEPTPSKAPAAATQMLRAVTVERRDIFDPREQRHWFARVANRLHIMTQAPVVRRELLFTAGEPYDSARIAESERNLRALGVFRRVLIDTVRTDSGLVARVTTKDGWSTKADWRFRSAGGDVALTMGLVEDNLLGTATSAALRYRKDPDRTSVTVGFRRPRLLFGRVSVGADYDNRSDGRAASALLEQPFFALTSPYGFRLEAEAQDGRILRFLEGRDTAFDTLSRRYVMVRGSMARALRASSAGYVRIGVVGQLLRDDYRPERSAEPFDRTVTAAFGPYLTVNRARFLVARGFAGFAREEDIDLGLTFRTGLLLAPKAFGYERNGIGPELDGRIGATIPYGFAYLDMAARGLMTSAGVDSGSAKLAGTVVFQPVARHVTVLHLEGGWLKDPRPGAEFDLGLGVGPRAFEAHAFTGDRAVFATAEHRVTVDEDLFGLVGLGVAGFVDHGGAWYSGSRRRVGWDAGVGLRLGPSRTSDADALRFDLARRFANDVAPGGWVVTVGKGFAFAPLGRRSF